ncbi:MAG: hypothetical protein DWQ05_02635 [Calditrichaeota bacterium]|nr:MAG: hypothetical protein DWQ05_02635 [Calditrichota bacterium]
MDVRRVGSNPSTALIVDDELHSRQRLSRLLREIAPEINRITETSNAADAITKIKSTNPAVIFVSCPTHNKLSHVLTNGVAGDIPKISICKDYTGTKDIISALGGYYLKKPVDAQNLRDLLDALSAFRKKYAEIQRRGVHNFNSIKPQFNLKVGNTKYVKNQIQAYLYRLVVKRQGRFRLLPVEKVLWFGTEFRLVYAYTEKRRYPIDLGLEELERRLNPELFVRVHRSTIVNKRRIEDIVPVDGGRNKVLLNEPHKRLLPLSVSRTQPIRNIIEYYQ